MNHYFPMQKSEKQKELMALFCEHGIVHIDANPPRTTDPSIKRSKYYPDIKAAYADPRVLNIISDLFAEEINTQRRRLVNYNPTFIAASGNNGLPVAGLVAVKTNLFLSLGRDRAKNHADGGFIDGYIPTKKDSGVVISDVLDSGASARNISKIIEPAKTLQHLFVASRTNVEMREVVNHYSILSPGDVYLCYRSVA